MDLQQGTVVKGGSNPPNTSDKRPAAPQGSGQSVQSDTEFLDSLRERGTSFGIVTAETHVHILNTTLWLTGRRLSQQVDTFQEAVQWLRDNTADA